MKLLKGTFQPCRANGNGPDIECELPGPPDWLRPNAMEEWNRLHDPLVSAGILTGASWALFVTYCAVWGQCQDILSIGGKVDSSMLQQFRMLGASFGVDPLARTKLGSPEKSKDSKFGALKKKSG
jgi:phage terminase small subunit